MKIHFLGSCQWMIKTYRHTVICVYMLSVEHIVAAWQLRTRKTAHMAYFSSRKIYLYLAAINSYNNCVIHFISLLGLFMLSDSIDSP